MMPPALQLERLYDDHAQALYAFLLNFIRNEADTRDVLQNVFIKLARQPNALSKTNDERAFLIRVAHNEAVDLIRRRGTRQRNYDQFHNEIDSLFAATGDFDEETFHKALTEALGELPAEQRGVVHLKLWEGATFEAIAEALGISQNTAGSRYRYGIDKLRERLRPIYEEIK
jgi:RNA polymerase sigma-70 factor, ECF subfamily